MSPLRIEWKMGAFIVLVICPIYVPSALRGQVAAYVTRSEDDDEDSSRAWILARVVREKTQERVS